MYTLSTFSNQKAMSFLFEGMPRASLRNGGQCSWALRLFITLDHMFFKALLDGIPILCRAKCRDFEHILRAESTFALRSKATWHSFRFVVSAYPEFT
jgi:hypothetical protein